MFATPLILKLPKIIFLKHQKWLLCDSVLLSFLLINFQTSLILLHYSRPKGLSHRANLCTMARPHTSHLFDQKAERRWTFWSCCTRPKWTWNLFFPPSRSTRHDYRKVVSAILRNFQLDNGSIVLCALTFCQWIVFFCHLGNLILWKKTTTFKNSLPQGDIFNHYRAGSVLGNLLKLPKETIF